jgi:serine/threonine protein kinase
MAPELLRDECGAGDDDGEVDGKALDVWALGLTFYVLLFGKMPWSLEGSRRDLIDQIVDTDIKVPRPPVVYPPDMAPSQRDAFDESFAAVAGGTDSVAMSPRLPLDREHHRAVSATRPGSDEELPDAATLVTGLLEHPTAGLDSPALTSDTSSKQVVGGTDPLTFVPSSAHPLGSSPGLASGVVDAPVLTNSGRSARGLSGSSGNGWGLPNLQGDCIGATAGSRPLTTTSSAPRSPAANNASRDIATRWQRLLQRMLRRDPAKRPAISEVRTLCRRIAKRAATASDFAAQSMVIDSMACSPLANRDL